jgi:hypothetical protein
MAVAPTAGANGASQARHAAQDGYGSIASFWLSADYFRSSLGAHRKQIGNLETVRAKRARAAGMSPAARALRSDVVRRAASRGGTLRCAEARRVAYRDVDKSYASHRLR